ncbi:MAG: hypothetical protein CLLPBCKN_007691 [Chroococcidiopsis cubana SAG 39.79]|nr:hypothetical protein [Chroococcidiopsis cubana SAG 39.79]
MIPSISTGYERYQFNQKQVRGLFRIKWTGAALLRRFPPQPLACLHHLRDQIYIYYLERTTSPVHFILNRMLRKKQQPQESR